MHLNGVSALGIALVLIFTIQFLIGAFVEGHKQGRIRAPKFKRSKTLRQFPTFPVQGGEEDVELDF